MAETEAPQTWVSTGRGGAGNFPYTPRALAKRPVTLSTPHGREVDYRRQSIARSGRGGVGFWEPTPDDSSKQHESQEFERDQEIIKERAARRQSINTDGTFIFKSGRGGAGNIASPTEQRLPTTATEGAALERVHSYGRGGSNYRYGDAIPMVDFNKIEDEERREAKSRPSSLNSSSGESGFSTFTSYASAFFNALTPAENRIENMSPVTSPTTPSSASSKRSSIIGGGRGGAGNYTYATYKSSTAKSSSATPSPAIPSLASPSQAHIRGEPSSSGYAASHGQDHYPEMPSASGSSSSGASGSRASSSRANHLNS